MSFPYRLYAVGSRNSARGLATLPGLSISCKLVALREKAREEPVHLEHVERELSPENCAKLVPDHIIRALPRLRRKMMLEQEAEAGRRVMMVDGSYCELSRQRTRLAPRTQLKELEKREERGLVRQLRTRERLYGEILSIITESVRSPILRRPVWRITRVEPSADYQYCVVRWTIDDPADHSMYLASISDALQGSADTVRYELSRRLSLKKSPQVRFEYEDYTAINLAHEIDGAAQI